jgi:hypothetical protein
VIVRDFLLDTKASRKHMGTRDSNRGARPDATIRRRWRSNGVHRVNKNAGQLSIGAARCFRERWSQEGQVRTGLPIRGNSDVGDLHGKHTRSVQRRSGESPRLKLLLRRLPAGNDLHGRRCVGVALQHHQETIAALRRLIGSDLRVSFEQ